MTVATFTDANSANDTGTYTATINWGDGQYSSGTISNVNSVYSVKGSHTYAEEGTYSISVATFDNGVTDPANPVTTSSASIVDAAMTGQGLSSPIAATQGIAFNSVKLATFQDPALEGLGGCFRDHYSLGRWQYDSHYLCKYSF